VDNEGEVVSEHRGAMAELRDVTVALEDGQGV
jgi:hypothetical protein